MYFTLYQLFLHLFPRNFHYSTLKYSGFRYSPEKFLTALESLPQENSSDRKTDHEKGRKIKRDQINKDYSGQGLFWGIVCLR